MLPWVLSSIAFITEMWHRHHSPRCPPWPACSPPPATPCPLLVWGVQGTGGTSSALLRTLTLCWGLRARTQSEPHSVSAPRLASSTPTRQAQERGSGGAGGRGGEAGGGRRGGTGAGLGREAAEGDELLRARVREAGLGEVTRGDTEGLGRTLAGGQSGSAGDQLAAHALALAAAAAAAGGSAVYGFGGDGLLRLTAQGSVLLSAGGAGQVRQGLLLNKRSALPFFKGQVRGWDIGKFSLRVKPQHVWSALYTRSPCLDYVVLCSRTF